MCSKCPGSICNTRHLNQTHKINVPDLTKIFEDIRKMQVVEMKPVFVNGLVSYVRKIKRKPTLDLTRDFLEPFINKIKLHLVKDI